MSKQPENKKVVFRRVRGRIVPIKVTPREELVSALAGGAAFGAVAGYTASTRKTGRHIAGLGYRLSLTKPLNNKVPPPLFSLRSLPKGAQKQVRAIQRAAGLTEKAKAKFFVKASVQGPKFLKNFSKPFLFAGAFVAAAGAYGAGKKLLKPKASDSEAMKAAKDIGAVGIGLSALTATNFGFFKGTGRSVPRSLVAAVRYTPAWIPKLGEWSSFKVGAFKSLF